jgi:ribosome biogenesis protein UTP30
VNALYASLQSKQEENKQTGGASALFGDEEDLFLSIAMKTTPVKAKSKPYQIPLVHSLYGRDGMDFCLITKDPVAEYATYLEQHPVDGCSKVLGIRQLKDKFSTYQLKRELVQSYDLFLCDDRVSTVLPPLLGKAFFTRKKQPFPVRCTGRNWEKNLASARDSTFFFLTAGPCTAVKVASSSFEPSQVVENIMGALEAIVARVPRKWNNVQAIHLKTSQSAALPLYTSLPTQTSTYISAPAAAKVTAKRGPPSVAPAQTEAREPVQKKAKVSVPVGNTVTAKGNTKTSAKTGRKSMSVKKSTGKGRTKARAQSTRS